MLVIYKYELQVVDLQELPLPAEAIILHVGVQSGGVFLWAMVNPVNVNEKRVIEIIGTGSPVSALPPDVTRVHIGTIARPPFIWHIFEQVCLTTNYPI